MPNVGLELRTPKIKSRLLFKLSQPGAPKGAYFNKHDRTLKSSEWGISFRDVQPSSDKIASLSSYSVIVPGGSVSPFTDSRALVIITSAHLEHTACA